MTHWLSAGPQPPMPTDTLSQVLMVVGVVMIGFLITISIRGKIAKRNANRPSPREHIESLKSNLHDRQDLGALRAEMYETAQMLASQLTARTTELEQLIVDADERIAMLRGQQPVPQAAADPPAPLSFPTPTTSTTEESPRRGSAPEPASDVDPLTRSVYSLADAGHDATTIARELDEQIGKVELILALRGTA
ncbi:MAG: hypothetical protein AAF432_05190 [Planctomycetota bacterium]